MDESQEQKRAVVIVGETASGKSALAVAIARRLGGEIVSADSRQVYRGLNIGTGKITKKEMRGVPHHLLDVADTRRQFTAADYQKIAREKIAAIFSRGRLPIICGGTGHYIDAALGRVAIPEVPPNPKLRKKLEKKTPLELFTLLKKIDPHRANTIERYNPRRLVRAIEIALADSSKRAKLLVYARSFDICWIGLMLQPAELKKKISKRLLTRIETGGMIEEARRLHRGGLSWKRMEELGLEYRYLSRYLRGNMTKVEMIKKLQTEIWRYAKRQMRWFKRNKEIKWFLPSQRAQIFAILKKYWAIK